MLIIFIVIVVLIFVGSRYLRKDVWPFVLKAQGDDRQLGRPVTNHGNGHHLGALTSFEVEDDYSYEWDSEHGELVKIPHPLNCRITFSCEGEGTISDEWLYTTGTRYSIGGTCTIRAG